MPTPGPAELLIILVIALMFVGVAVLLIRGIRGPQVVSQRDPALDALRTRLAAGEIDEAEFERLRSVLQRG
jgi:uncharacterized membrane protein